MITSLTKADLLAFEERVKTAFIARQIHAPIHLSGGNEDQVIAAFQDIRPQDWVFSTWRSHYHALLKGVPPERLFQAILEGRSMYYQDEEHKFLTSALVGGILPIALGVALGAKRLDLDERVWVFVGDMAAHTGIFEEFKRYAQGHALPVSIVIEDNGLSTNTPTEKVWGQEYAGIGWRRYSYERTVPHTGVGEWVTFG